VLTLEPARPLQVRHKPAVHQAQRVQEAAVLGRAVQRRLVDHPQHQHRVATRPVPQLAVEALEQLDRLGVPRPPQVVRDLEKGRKRRRDRGNDAERMDVRRE